MKSDNIKSLILLLLFSLSSLFFYSCDKDRLNEDRSGRVVLLYMAANNNLSTFAEANILSLKEGYLPLEESEDILLVYKHIKGKEPKLVRFYKNKSGVVMEDVVCQYEDHNSASSEVLELVLKRVEKIFPDKEYGLILWSHGTGWLPSGYYNSASAPKALFTDPYASIVKSFALDRGREMEITELKKAIPMKLSYLIFDCCLMGGIETIYEIKDRADYIIASPTEILASGFPYAAIMEPLFKRKADLNRVCELYYNHYASESGVYQSATVALYKTSELQSLANVCKEIFANTQNDITNMETSNLQRYFRLDKRWFWDIDDFVYYLAEPSEYLRFKNALDNVVVAKWHTPYFLDISINKFSGVSTYIPNVPNSYLKEFYLELDWNKDTELVK